MPSSRKSQLLDEHAVGGHVAIRSSIWKATLMWLVIGIPMFVVPGGASADSFMLLAELGGVVAFSVVIGMLQIRQMAWELRPEGIRGTELSFRRTASWEEIIKLSPAFRFSPVYLVYARGDWVPLVFPHRFFVKNCADVNEAIARYADPEHPLRRLYAC